MNKNLLGIDFEDWFHPELIKNYLKHGTLEPKVVNGLDKILELLNGFWFKIKSLITFPFSSYLIS